MLFAKIRPHCHYYVPVKLNCVSTTLISVSYRNTDSSLEVGKGLSNTATRAWFATKLMFVRVQVLTAASMKFKSLLGCIAM
jgi:hypothetical protein